MVLPRRMPYSVAAVPAALTLLAALPPTPAQAQTPGADLRIITPRSGEALGSATFDLDVAFQSKSRSPIVTAEFWVDGVRWERRDLDAPQVKNILSFKVDASSLSAGMHTVVVKVFTANGGVASTSLQIMAGTNEGVSEGAFASSLAMAFRNPKNGQRVSGTVELTLDAQDRAGGSPYITIYIDKQFKTLKNYPPYSYTWDTTGVPNGWHTVEAMGYTEGNSATTSRRIRLFVDNPGGATVRMDEIPDLSNARSVPAPNAAASTVAPLTIPLPNKAGAPKKNAPAARAVAVKVAPVIARPATPAVFAENTGTGREAAPSALGVRSGASSAASSAVDVRLVTPSVPPLDMSHPRKSNEAVTRSAAAARSATVSALAAPSAAAPALRVQPLAAVPVASPASATISTPRSVTPSALEATAPKVAVAAPKATVVTAPRPAAVTVAPRHSIAGPTRIVQVKPVAKATRSQAAPRTTVRPAFNGYVRTSDVMNELQVAFNGTRIAFDVAPRVEAGMPLAPFRQIFEHTGGAVTWVPETRVVRAVNAEREIVFGVGRSSAMVNGESVSLERPAFLDRGRAIVPLSFVGKALDVDVQFDPVTGRLQITSKK